MHSQGLEHKEEERGEGIEIEAGRLSLYGRYALKAIRAIRRGKSGRVTATLASEIDAPSDAIWAVMLAFDLSLCELVRDAV